MISFIIPALNEEKRVGKTVQSVKQAFPKSEVIVVDDASQDKTSFVAGKAGARVIRNPENMGFTESVRRGVQASRGDVLVKIDADGEIPIQYFEKAVEKLENYDIVIGRKEGFHRPSEKIISFTTSLFTRLPYGADVMPGLIVFKRKVYDEIGFDERESWLYGFLLKAVKRKRGIGLVPIKFRKRKDSRIGYSFKSDLKLLSAGLRAFVHVYLGF